MMWPFAPPQVTCKACGTKRFESAGNTCKACGYVEPKELPPAKLIFCAECACHYLDGCELHGDGRQTPETD